MKGMAIESASSSHVQHPRCFFRTGPYMKVMFSFFLFLRLSKVLTLIKKNIEPCQYQNISLPQFAKLRVRISYSHFVLILSSAGIRN